MTETTARTPEMLANAFDEFAVNPKGGKMAAIAYKRCAAMVRDWLVTATPPALSAPPAGWRPIGEAKPGGGMLIGNPDGVYGTSGVPDKWVRGFIREDGTAWDDDGYPLSATVFMTVPSFTSCTAAPSPAPQEALTDLYAAEGRRIFEQMTSLFEMTGEANIPGTDSYTILWQAREFLRGANAPADAKTATLQWLLEQWEGDGWATNQEAMAARVRDVLAGAVSATPSAGEALTEALESIARHADEMAAGSDASRRKAEDGTKSGVAHASLYLGMKVAAESIAEEARRRAALAAARKE